MSNISITYNTSTESNVTQEFNTAIELKSFINNNKANFTGAMKVVCDNSITDCNYMFYDCSNLITIYCEQNWNNSNVTDSAYMFNSCNNLKGAVSYDSTKININYANPNTGYFSYLPSRKFLVNLNMDQNEIKNMLLDKRNAAPNLPAAGQIYYNTTDKKIYIYNGIEWIAGSGFKSSLSLVEAQPYESPEVI